jgi:hypothetical protein
MVFIGYTTVNRAYRSTLWFVVKAFTLGTFIRDYEIHLIGNRLLQVFCIHRIAVGKHNVTGQ